MRGRFGYVDALRGLAIVAMVLYELHRHGLIPAGGALGAILREGSRGLDLFFVISGFALAYPALTVLRTDGRVGIDLARYAIRRVARVVPAAWVAILAIALAPAVAALTAHPSLAVARAALPPLGTIVRELTFLQTPPAAPDAFWAVAVAVRWYVLFPVLLLLWTRSPRAFASAGIAIVVLDPLTRLHGLGLGEMPAFMLGIVAADWRVRHVRAAGWAPYLAVVSGFAGFALEPVVSGPMFAFSPFPADDLGWQACAFFVLAGIGHSRRLERAFDRPVLAAAGSASYAVALVVEPVALACGSLVQRLPAAASHLLGIASPRSATFATTQGAVVAALCVAFAGFVLYRLVDRPIAERDPRMRLADGLEPVLSRVRSLLRTNGILVLGRRDEGAPFEASGAGTEFYAPPPRGDAAGLASMTRRSGSTHDLEEEMIATKKRLADRTTALFADAEYEASRASGIATAAPAYAFPEPSGLSILSAQGTAPPPDVWQKPRRPSADAPPPETTPAGTSEAAAGEPSDTTAGDTAVEDAEKPAQDPPARAGRRKGERDLPWVARTTHDLSAFDAAAAAPRLSLDGAAPPSEPVPPPPAALKTPIGAALEPLLAPEPAPAAAEPFIAPEPMVATEAPLAPEPAPAAAEPLPVAAEATPLARVSGPIRFKIGAMPPAAATEPRSATGEPADR